MDEPLFFDELPLGGCWKSRARTITESDVAAFAGLTGDYDPLHMDHEHARNTPFGKPVAHGLLGLSFVAGLGSHSPSVQTIAFVSVDNWSFLRPLYFGDTVHVLTEVVEKQSKGRRHGRIRWKRQLVNQRGEVVQEGFFETVVAISSVDVPSKPHFSERQTDQPVKPNG